MLTKEQQAAAFSENFEYHISKEHLWNALTVCVLAKAQGLELKVSVETALKTLPPDRTTGIDKQSNRKVVLNLDVAAEFLKAVIVAQSQPAESLITQMYGNRSEHFQRQGRGM